ncbi:MAG: hypothetical protein ISS69_10605 [Phycisphaerae bacterium]|nr:hypothetical protein [Phycisphaerae bacterium]
MCKQIRDIIETVVPNIDVQPVVIFPGWFVDPTGSLNVWVFNEKYFMKRIKDREPSLSDDKVRLRSKVMEVHVRLGATGG